MKTHLIASTVSLMVLTASFSSASAAPATKNKEQTVSASSQSQAHVNNIKQVKKIKRKKKHKKKAIKHDALSNRNAEHLSTYVPVDSIPLPPVRETKTVNHKISPTKHAALVEKEKCHFIFWEVECPKENDNISSPTPTVSSFNNPQNPAPVKKGLDMVGLSAREDRQKLKSYFQNKIEVSIDPLHIPWCAAWANSILADTGYATTDSLMARSFLHYGIKIKEPQEGDIVVLSRGRNRENGHVGFYLNTVLLSGQKYVAVLGGNQDKKVSVAYYPASRVLGYRRPVIA
jgi:uncharacterized protein (TIGR02594 family)